MSTKLDLGKIFFLILFLTLSVMTVMAGTIKGSITDKQTREPLTGATVQIVGTTQGAIADMDGNYSLNVTNGIYTLSIKYIGYKDIVVNNVKSGKADVVLNFELESDAQTLGEVSVVARKNLEGERALQMERRKATLAIENIGSKEMSIKGISNVEEGVKKITGISIADAGQLIVRGLGDRYSTTTLNGLPIASPNPDNKLIPLDLFPSSTIQNITVSKVYNAEAFADGCTHRHQYQREYHRRLLQHRFQCRRQIQHTGQRQLPDEPQRLPVQNLRCGPGRTQHAPV